MRQIHQEPYPCGVTEVSKKEFERHRDSLGDIQRVIVFNALSDTADTEIVVVGSEANLHLDGFSVGYYGEGPRGMIWLLNQVGAVFTEDDVHRKPISNRIEFLVEKV